MQRMEDHYMAKAAKKKDKYTMENSELRGRVEELMKEVEDLNEEAVQVE